MCWNTYEPEQQRHNAGIDSHYSKANHRPIKGGLAWIKFGHASTLPPLHYRKVQITQAEP